jgi:membrane protein YdbS with pleckstrin-like domain
VTDRRLPRFRRTDETTTGLAPEPTHGSSIPHPPAASLPDQASPFGGSVIETGALWRRRHRQSRREADWVDPATQLPTPIGGTEAASVAGSPVGDRVRSARAHFLPTPEETIHRHLGSGEEVLHIDHPSMPWFLAKHSPTLGALILVGVGFAVAVREGWEIVAAVLPLVALVLLIVLAFQRLADRYTAYVITNARMIRMSGVLNTRVESIPWIRVTDIDIGQTFLERMLHCITVNIESANETTGLRRMSGIGNPEEFNRHLMDMVVAKQGATTPLGRTSDYTIGPPPRSLMGFRKRQAPAVGSNLVVDEPTSPRSSDDDTEVGETVPVEPSSADLIAARRAAEAARANEPVAPDPELPSDLSNMDAVGRSEMAAERIRQDHLLGRDSDPPSPPSR